MSSTYDELASRLRQAFAALAPGADPVLRLSERGDYQANGVMALAKQLGRPPREVAADVLAHLDLEDWAEVGGGRTRVPQPHADRVAPGAPTAV
ncbi:Arginyl-Trna Synthetase, partial [mine drainage metagenome]